MSVVQFTPYGTHADVTALDARVAEKLISRRPHPQFSDVVIYNYTQKAMFDQVWDNETMQARGLVVEHSTGLILARPLPKFFNHEQIGELPWHLSFETTTKLDGSMFFLRCMPDNSGYPSGTRFSGTRGTFGSDQADLGRKILDASYGHVQFDTAITYIFEMIHPSNRIVVDYGNLQDLILLAMIDTATGKEISLDLAPVGLHVVERHDFANIADAEQIANMNLPNEEGFVVLFADGSRAKIKFSEYKRLHAIITNTSSKSVWRTLREGIEISSLFDQVPDEFERFVREWVDILQKQYAVHEEAGKIAFAAAGTGTRGEQAKRIIEAAGENGTAKAVAFAMLSGKPWTDIIWKALEPEFVPPPFADEG